MPIRLVDEYSAKVTDNVDDAKHQTVAGEHGQVGTLLVSGNRSASILSLFVERCTVAERVDCLALFLGFAHGVSKHVVDLVARVNFDVDKENHDDQHGVDDGGMEIIRQKSRLEASRGGVQDDTPGDQEGGKAVVHTGEGFDSRGTSKQEHGCHNDVGAEAKEEESKVGSPAPPSVHNLRDGVGRWSNLLQVNRQNTEEEDLNSGAGRIPEVLEVKDKIKVSVLSAQGKHHFSKK